MVEIKCLVCNKIFNVKSYRIKSAKFCSYMCSGLSRKGNSSWSKGLKLPYIPHFKKRGQTPWNKNPKIIHCLFCGKKVITYQKSKQKYCSNKCKENAHSRNFKKENSHFWRGGLTPISKRIRNSAKFINWRKKVFKRDNYTCQKCGQINTYLEAHHIKPFSLYPKLRFLINNGIALCRVCHKQTDNYGYKSIKELF